MTQSNGKRGTLYEQVLDYARREIDEASSKIDELRRTLSLLEARVEAAKAVYEAVAARLNLEDELEEGAEFQEASYLEAPPPLQAPEPPEEREEAEASGGNGNQSWHLMSADAGDEGVIDGSEQCGCEPRRETSLPVILVGVEHLPNRTPVVQGADDGNTQI